MWAAATWRPATVSFYVQHIHILPMPLVLLDPAAPLTALARVIVGENVVHAAGTFAGCVSGCISFKHGPGWLAMLTYCSWVTLTGCQGFNSDSDSTGTGTGNGQKVCPSASPVISAWPQLTTYHIISRRKLPTGTVNVTILGLDSCWWPAVCVCVWVCECASNLRHRNLSAYKGSLDGMVSVKSELIIKLFAASFHLTSWVSMCGTEHNRYHVFKL